ncbi:guanylate kinase, partial [bacterium]|nr:guanylate kinase [bacterium]
GLPVVSFFLLPPSLDVLRARIRGRGDSQDEIERRMKTVEKELARKDEYDYQIVNDVVDRTVDEIVARLADHRGRPEAGP